MTKNHKHIYINIEALNNRLNVLIQKKSALESQLNIVSEELSSIEQKIRWAKNKQKNRYQNPD